MRVARSSSGKITGLIGDDGRRGVENSRGRSSRGALRLLRLLGRSDKGVSGISNISVITVISAARHHTKRRNSGRRKYFKG